MNPASPPSPARRDSWHRVQAGRLSHSSRCVRNVTNETVDRLGLDAKNRGVQVTEVKPDSFADDLQMQPGMIILKVNRQAVNNEEDFRKVASQLKSGEDVVFLVRAGRGASGNTLLSGT